jgi:CHASE3 domain sensor protein
MKEQIEQRLRQLQQEFESGQQLLADLEQRQQSLRETLLRIGGAIQVLQELLQAGDTSPANGAAAADTPAVVVPGDTRGHEPASESDLP